MPGGSENGVGSSVDHIARNVVNSTSGPGNVAMGGVSVGAGAGAGAGAGGGGGGGGGGAGGGTNSTSGGYSALPNGTINERKDKSDRVRGDRERESRKRNSASNAGASLSTTDHNLVNLSVPEYNENADDNTVTTSTCNVDSPESHKFTDYPSYLAYYTTISSLEQRRRYKAEFNADYEEYKRLHAQMAMVSGRFKQLEERLKEEEAMGNVEGCKEVKRQILMEYNETKRDPMQRETKRRFHYLHEKLSHIKRLVLEYDTLNSSGSVMLMTMMANRKMGDTGEMDTIHY